MGRTTALKKWRSWHKDYAIAVGDTTKAYVFFMFFDVFCWCFGPVLEYFGRKVIPFLSVLYTQFAGGSGIMTAIRIARSSGYVVLSSVHFI